MKRDLVTIIFLAIVSLGLIMGIPALAEEAKENTARELRLEQAYLMEHVKVLQMDAQRTQQRLGQIAAELKVLDEAKKAEQATDAKKKDAEKKDKPEAEKQQ